jgi:hypothetical protein
MLEDQMAAESRIKHVVKPSISARAIDEKTQPCSQVSGWMVAALFLFSIGIASIPIFSYRFPSINDYLNHLARGYILLRYNDDPGAARFFVLNWKLLPNLAIDLWVLTIGQVLPLEIAGKLYIVSTLALLLTGVIFLHRAAFGKWSLWPFLALVLLYNRPLLAGFLSFLFGVALWLHALALWICLRAKSAVIRAPVLLVASLVIFFAHLFAFGILAVTIAVYELTIFVFDNRRRWYRRVGDLVIGAIPFLPALAILVLLTPHSSASGIVKYREVSARLTAFAAPILYNWRTDAVAYLILLAMFIWAVVKKDIHFNLPLVASVIALFILQWFMPTVIMTAIVADHRLPISIMFLAISATNPVRISYQQRLCFIITVGAIFVARIVTIEARWALDQPIYAEARAGLSLIPAGARVATAFPGDSFGDASAPAMALYYIPVWDILSRGGFTQTVFAYPTQNPLVFRSKYAALAAATSAPALWRNFVISDDEVSSRQPSSKISVALRGYDYIVFLDRQKFAVHAVPPLRPFYDGKYVRIYRTGTIP